METRNAVYADAKNTMISVEINHPEHGWIPFGAVLESTDAMNQTVLSALEGQEIAAFVEPKPLPVSALSATGRQLIAAAKSLSATDDFPDDMASNLMQLIRSDDELYLSWSADGLMRRSSEEMVQGETRIDAVMGEGQGKAVLDAIFVAAQ